MSTVLWLLPTESEALSTVNDLGWFWLSMFISLPDYQSYISKSSRWVFYFSVSVLISLCLFLLCCRAWLLLHGGADTHPTAELVLLFRLVTTLPACRISLTPVTNHLRSVLFTHPVRWSPVFRSVHWCESLFTVQPCLLTPVVVCQFWSLILIKNPNQH